MGLNNNKYCKNNKEKNLKKKTRLWPVERKDMQNNADISPVSKQVVFSTKETQEEQGKKKQDKTKNQ
jgi:hypothetical protein